MKCSRGKGRRVHGRQEVDTILSLGVISTVDDDGTIPARALLEKEGIGTTRRGKIYERA